MPELILPMFLAAECSTQCGFIWRIVQYTWNQLPWGWKQTAICHGHWNRVMPLNISNTLVTSLCGATQQRNCLRRGKKIWLLLILPIKQSKVKGTAQEIWFLGAECPGVRHIPMGVISQITATSLPAKQKHNFFSRHCRFLEN